MSEKKKPGRPSKNTFVIATTTTCRICDKEYRDVDRLAKHFKKHRVMESTGGEQETGKYENTGTPVRKKHFNCSECFGSYETRTGCVNHYKLTHPQEYAYNVAALQKERSNTPKTDKVNQSDKTVIQSQDKLLDVKDIEHKEPEKEIISHKTDCENGEEDDLDENIIDVDEIIEISQDASPRTEVSEKKRKDKKKHSRKRSETSSPSDLFNDSKDFSDDETPRKKQRRPYGLPASVRYCIVKMMRGLNEDLSSDVQSLFEVNN